MLLYNNNILYVDDAHDQGDNRASNMRILSHEPVGLPHEDGL